MSLRSTAWIAALVLGLTFVANPADAQVKTPDNPTAREPGEGSTTPTEHPLPKGAASVADDPAIDDWGGPFWVFLGGVLTLVVILGAGGLIISMRQRREGGQSQLRRT